MAGSGVYPNMVAELARARASRYCNLSPYLRWWTRGGVIGHLTRVKEHVEYIACTLPVETYGLQRWAAKLLTDNIPMATLDDCIAKRLTTFLKVKTSAATAAMVRKRICTAKGQVPPCVDVADYLQCLDHDRPIVWPYGRVPVWLRRPRSRQVLALPWLLVPEGLVAGSLPGGGPHFPQHVS